MRLNTFLDRDACDSDAWHMDFKENRFSKIKKFFHKTIIVMLG
jgi:hypothetical protein